MGVMKRGLLVVMLIDPLIAGRPGLKGLQAAIGGAVRTSIIYLGEYYSAFT